MAWLPVAATVASAVLGAVGNYQAGQATKRQAAQMQQAKEFEAAQLEQNAGQQIAAAQRKALEERRRATLVASRALAVSAASGSGASDPTVEKIISDIAGEGAYRAGLQLYEGEDIASRLRSGAQASRFEGESIMQYGRERARAANVSAFGSLFSGGASLYTKYGMGGPQNSKTSFSGGFDAGTPLDPRFA